MGPGPPFFWYDTDFSQKKKKKKIKKCFLQKKSKKPRPSFFWYNNDSGHKGPCRVTQPKCGTFYSLCIMLYFLKLHPYWIMLDRGLVFRMSDADLISEKWGFTRGVYTSLIKMRTKLAPLGQSCFFPACYTLIKGDKQLSISDGKACWSSIFDGWWACV